MISEQQERFFFQEFIRENHASRIKEWITGRHSRHWGTAVKAITEAIDELLKPFPARFRENLATVCESHHRPDLNKLDIYPLCQRYGSETLEMANVQYAALILRTVDLIHVTKDRTPSIMYKTINLSDPKGVDEWDKQKDTFAVRHAGRAFKAEEEATHVITVSADFTEERPFFALTEYIAWADTEIKQTKRWSDQSRNQKDAANFWFPWQAIQGDLRVEGNEPQQMRFEFDRGRLLDLLVGHAIYNDATVAIRELLQNSIDAVRFRHHLDTKAAQAAGRPNPPMGKVSITWDKEKRQLVVADQGTGMDLDIIKHHLMRVGSSFYDTPQFATEFKGFTPVSRFGIGILTCFMISDDIEIVTIKSTCGYRIRMSSVHADYLLRELPVGDPKLAGTEPHGTRVTLIVRDGVDLTKRTVNDILRYWIILPECRVEYNEAGKPAEKIGFDSPIDALKYYYDEGNKDRPRTWKDIEYTLKQRDINGGQFQMAVALRSGLYPEKSFAQPPRNDLPSICIEGIRVSDFLPGFGPRLSSLSVSTIVSVRGVRGLRTTVSRSGLEQDEEYLNLGRICADMLLDHIKEEIDRLSNEKGNPLSRASTAGKWLTTDLMTGISLIQIQDYLVQQRKKIPLIVLETVKSQNDKLVVERTLISPEKLGQEDHFWTIESRLVDSLGIISRDLGRELSLNEFITTLAPEHVELGHTPILPDASQFSDDIFGSHHASLVQFSRLYQQTAIKWTPGKTAANEAAKTALKDEVFSAILNQEYRKLEEAQRQRVPVNLESKTTVAEIAGDEPEVKIVRTRMLTLLSNKSESGRIWELLQNGVKLSSERKEPHECLLFLRLANLFEHIVASRIGGWNRGSYIDEEHRIGWRDLENTWNEFVIEANSILLKYGLTGNIPDTIECLRAEKVFNASDYWRDWHRTEKK
jgi:hypothetical protein